MENPGTRPGLSRPQPSITPPWAVQQQSGAQLDPATGRARVHGPSWGASAPSAQQQELNRRHQIEAQSYRNPILAGVQGANAYAANQIKQNAGIAGANNYAAGQIARNQGIAGANNYAMQEMLRIQQEALAQNPNGAM